MSLVLFFEQKDSYRTVAVNSDFVISVRKLDSSDEDIGNGGNISLRMLGGDFILVRGESVEWVQDRLRP